MSARPGTVQMKLHPHELDLLLQALKREALRELAGGDGEMHDLMMCRVHELLREVPK